MTASNDRLGARWGLAGGVALANMEEVREMACYADVAGFDSLWISHSMAVDPIVALAAAAADIPNLSEVGTSVVPLYGRHPLGLAQLAGTASSALDGRFTLGVGPSHRLQVEGNLGLSWDRPFRYTEDFLDGMLPLLDGRAVDNEGTEIVTRAELGLDVPPTPVLLAALGPRMLGLAGARLAGTTLGQCGPKTIASYIVPTLHDAAEKAGRAEPRVMALIRICVTDDFDPAYAQAQQIGAFYKQLPSYAAVLAKEGLTDPADLHLIGSWDRVLEGLSSYAEAGVTDFRIEVAAPTIGERDATRAALSDYLSS